MIVKRQKQIKFINDCKCVVDEGELAAAIIWYQNAPTAQWKHIYMHGSYPAVSIHSTKIHIHRLLMLYWNNGTLPKGMQVHHLNGNKKDASRENLALIKEGVHQSLHNKGKIIPAQTIEAIRRFNHSRKGKRMKRRREDVTPKMVLQYHRDGMSFNQIAKITKLDWECVKQRYEDAIHDNPELLNPDKQ